MNRPEPDISNLLALYRAAKSAETGPLWRADSDAAVERHGEACDAVWGELARLNSLFTGDVKAIETREMVARRLEKKLAAIAKTNLRHGIADLIERMFENTEQL